MTLDAGKKKRRKLKIGTTINTEEDQNITLQELNNLRGPK